ncbi:DUF4190 domain-containing protein [Streptomyces sp. SID3343]|uniref:DUF4190 domain-containing protein n=1 Tax=Streptomyces sp. SID3343 TaxID=2690260 RepID=UPI00136FEB91|nr:DUF4190 domain-containing protein [Streptomyces sp. SID3343]MYW02720.1 DUF4190 domain-containing protein [Streptomyces sp. SID3343]
MSGGYDGGGYGGGYGYGAPPPNRGNGLAVAALVCGIVGLLCFGFILGPLAIIFGGVGISKANQGADHKGLAIAGLVLGIVDVAFLLIFIAVWGSIIPYA